MARIKNKLRQPVVVNLADGSSVHFLAGEIVSVPLAQYQSVELQKFIKSGDFIVLSLDKEEIK